MVCCSSQSIAEDRSCSRVFPPELMLCASQLCGFICSVMPGTPAVASYLYLLLVGHLMLGQSLSIIIRGRVVFGSWGGLFVKVQLGHQRVTA